MSDWECVVVKDSPTAPIDSLVRRLNDRRFRVVAHEKNLGRGAARVTGVRAAVAPFVAWQDADDWSCPDRLSILYPILKSSPRVAAVASSMFLEANPGEIVGIREVTNGFQHASRPWMRITIPHPTMLLRRQPCLDTGYDPTLKGAEDYHYLRRFLRNNVIQTVQLPLYVYRLAGSQSLARYVDAAHARLSLVLAPGFDIIDRAFFMIEGAGQMAYGIMRNACLHNDLRPARATRNVTPDESAYVASLHRDLTRASTW
jgi:glycosyltransferase involved in cell wall biosynthesis